MNTYHISIIPHSAVGKALIDGITIEAEWVEYGSSGVYSFKAADGTVLAMYPIASTIISEIVPHKYPTSYGGVDEGDEGGVRNDYDRQANRTSLSTLLFHLHTHHHSFSPSFHPVTLFFPSLIVCEV